MSPAVLPAAAGLVTALLAPLNDLAAGVGWLCIACAAFWGAVIGWHVLAARRGNRRGQVGDDTIAMLCRCCNGELGDDCLCTADCGSPRCQAACPAHAEGCGPGANLLAYPSLACPACDWIAARLEEGGDGRG